MFVGWWVGASNINISTAIVVVHVAISPTLGAVYLIARSEVTANA